MRSPAPSARPLLPHAVRVAAVTTVLIAAVYFTTCVVFDTVDSHRLVAQVDAHLHDRLGDVGHHALLLRPQSEADDDHDVESAPVLLWKINAQGHAVALSDGAPKLPDSAWSRSGRASTARLGAGSFRVEAARVDGGWVVAAQSLTETAHVQAVLETAEVIAGPVLLLAVFLGALIIGIKASSPIEQARRRQLEFTADASHELRTPLSVIEAETSLALGTPGRDANEYRTALERVGREGRRLRKIVEDLLWLARFDSEPSTPSDEAVDVSGIAVTCAERFEAVADARGIDLSVQTAAVDEARLNAPPQWIDRLAGVLVDNACRYAEQGGTVVITVAAQGQRVNLVVEDDGPGIPPDERARLFDRFHRATDEGSGSGLGLAIADAVVRSTGGRWSVGESSLGGARMQVSWHRSGADVPTPGRPVTPNGDVSPAKPRESTPLAR